LIFSRLFFFVLLDQPKMHAMPAAKAAFTSACHFPMINLENARALLAITLELQFSTSGLIW
jgi:hypothetical protein